MGEKINWGILGSGQIARLFAEGLSCVNDANLYAVGSRSATNAEQFAKLFNIEKAYGSFESLVADPAIDVIYVATPHHMHRDHCLLALEAGKAVLCEKPFAINAEQVQEVISMARSKQLFCMEAMWMRFLPAMVALKTMVQAGTLGAPIMLTANFGTAFPFNSNSRQFSLEFAGGALLDLGVYPISLCQQLLGDPAEVVTTSIVGDTGVDEYSSVILKYQEGHLATLQSSLRHSLPTDAVITGTKAEVKVHSPLYRPHKISVRPYTLQPENTDNPSRSPLKELVKSNSLFQSFALKMENYLQPLLGAMRTKVYPFVGNGYNYEAMEVNRCLQLSKLESDIMSLDDTLSVARIVDQVRAQWGLKYPFE